MTRRNETLIVYHILQVCGKIIYETKFSRKDENGITKRYKRIEGY